MEIKYKVSVFVIDFDLGNVLLSYDKDSKKWILPGEVINSVNFIDVIKNLVFDKSGIKIKFLGPSWDGVTIEPIAVTNYKSKNALVIDIEYIALPLTRDISDEYASEMVWYPVNKLDKGKDVDSKIKAKVSNLVIEYSKR